MPARVIDADLIVLSGTCPAGDAEYLLRHLIENPGSSVDLRECDAIHTAVVQILMVSGATLNGPPRGEVLRDLIVPAISSIRKSS